jgi:hypothetical protein
MALITLTFTSPVNVSAQIGDVAYYTNDVNGSNIVLMGNITNVTTYTITVDIGNATPRPTTNSFILFSKNNDANINALTGYYAEVQLRNDSTKIAEMYSVASEVFVSSK